MGLWQWIWDPCRVAKSEKETYRDFCPRHYLLWAVERSEMESGMYKAWGISKFRGGTKAEDNSRLTDMHFSDDPCIPKLWPRREIHPFHPRRQGHTVLGGMVWNSCYRELCWDMSSNGHIAPRDSSNFCFLPFCTKSCLPYTVWSAVILHFSLGKSSYPNIVQALVFYQM